MDPDKSKQGFLIIIHIIALIAIMLLALFGGSIVSYILSTNNVILDNLIYTVVYIGITLSIGLLYAKYILHFTCKEIGVCSKAPEWKWIFTGICLPLAVTAFYLLFTDGQIVKNDNAENLWFYLANALIYVGLSAGICEEFIFRGLIMHMLEREWNRTIAIVVPSVLFAFMHTINMRLGLVDFLLLLAAGSAVGIMFSLIAFQSGTIWSSAAVHALWNIVIIGGVFVVESPDNGLTANFFYRYELSGSNILLTGGRFGIESALPAIIGYCLVSIMALFLMKKKSKHKGQPWMDGAR